MTEEKKIAHPGKEAEEKDFRKALSERLPQFVFERIHVDIGHATMCWEFPEKAGVFDAEKASKIAFELSHFVADLLSNNESVLPMRISKTGDPNESLLETIICTSISGLMNYKNNMPKQLTLCRSLASGEAYTMRYIQEG